MIAEDGILSAPSSTHCYRAMVASFKYRDELPPEDQAGFGNSPRRSHLDTAVVLSPDDYDNLLRCRDDLSGKAKTPEQLYDLLSELRTGIMAVSNSKTVNVQNDVDELERLAGMANRAVGMVIGTAR